MASTIKIKNHDTNVPVAGDLVEGELAVTTSTGRLYTKDNGGTLVEIGGGFTGVTASAAELNIMDGVTSTTAELNILDGVTSTAAELNILDGVTSTAAELNKLDGVTATTAELNKLAGTPAGLTSTELGYVDGVTSSIQTQMNLKSPLASPTFTGTAALPITTHAGKATFSAEIVEAVYAVPSSTTPSLNPANGTIQTWTLTGNSTPTTVLATGEFITLKILDGTAYTITWTSILAAGNWVGGAAPTLDATGSTWVELWNAGGTIYGALVGVAG